METISERVPKRPLDEDDDGDDKKKLKTGSDLHFSPTLEIIKIEKDEKKWSLLPSIVYELLALFKNSEKIGEKINLDEYKQVC